MQRFTPIALLALVAAASSSKHDLIVGQRMPGDQLIEEIRVNEKPTSFGSLEYVEPIIPDGVNKITRIEIIEYKNGEAETTPEITVGGVGTPTAVVKFRRVRGRGIHFDIKVYGKQYSFPRYA